MRRMIGTEFPACALALSHNCEIAGWAFDQNGIEEIAILLDGTVVGYAQLGLARPDVAQAFPEAAHAAIGRASCRERTPIVDGYETLALEIAYRPVQMN